MRYYRCEGISRGVDVQVSGGEVRRIGCLRSGRETEVLLKETRPLPSVAGNTSSNSHLSARQRDISGDIFCKDFFSCMKSFIS